VDQLKYHTQEGSVLELVQDAKNQTAPLLKDIQIHNLWLHTEFVKTAQTEAPIDTILLVLDKETDVTYAPDQEFSVEYKVLAQLAEQELSQTLTIQLV